MANFQKTFARFATDALCGRVRCDQFRIFSLELFQLFEKFVELKIADLRIVEHVVAVLVVADILTQCVHFFPDSVVRRSHGPRIIVCLRPRGRGPVGGCQRRRTLWYEKTFTTGYTGTRVGQTDACERPVRLATRISRSAGTSDSSGHYHINV